MSDPRFDLTGFDPEDLERMTQDAERTMRRLADVQEELGEIHGRGTGADGLISVVTDGSGHVERVELNPRVMRLDSETLAEELMRTVREAQEDGERKARELLNGALGEMKLPQGPLDVDEIETQLRRSHESFVHDMEGRMSDRAAWRPDRGRG
ncbi:YbaB/EbfC family nucleoid-associated protein [Streptosporangium sp. NPDC087985]|uniref:YbaB/EbfC family nucleoid-associated protein n=1 Tax=Streptosporangium sp. NPDC087985 TaxID=3366196 RepID=UPI0038265DF1